MRIDETDADFATVVSKACESELLALAEKLMTLRMPGATLQDVEVETEMEKQ